MSLDQGLVDWALEAMAPLGSPAFRKMMGGATLYCDGVVFAIKLSIRDGSGVSVHKRQRTALCDRYRRVELPPLAVFRDGFREQTLGRRRSIAFPC